MKSTTGRTTNSKDVEPTANEIISSKDVEPTSGGAKKKPSRVLLLAQIPILINY